jgi:hypothetical protein
MNYQTTIAVNGGRIKILGDILPKQGPVKMLIVAKTPAPVSVDLPNARHTMHKGRSSISYEAACAGAPTPVLHSG